MEPLFRDKNWLHNQYAIQKQSIRDIAKLCQCTSGWIFYWLKKHGIPRRNPNWYKTAIKQPYHSKQWLHKQYIVKQRPISSIAKECNRTLTVIHRWLKKHNIPVRNQVECRTGKLGSKYRGWFIDITKMRKYTYCANHPNGKGTKHNHILNYRLVMEKHLGRYLKPEEVVHHKDGNTLNDSISNLQLFPDDSEHYRYERLIQKFAIKYLQVQKDKRKAGMIAKQLLFGSKPDRHLRRLFNEFINEHGYVISA